jgi:glycosyltransferase involved in cell wall biosynthesis
MRLIIEKIKLALFKRTGAVQQKKNHASWEAKGYRNEPSVSFVIQSHNKSLQICHILPKLRQYKDAEIIVIDDGSSMEHTKRLTEALTGANEFLLRANDLFENVTYDKALRLANGKYVALMQDDDDFEDVSWVTEAIALFERHPKMVILGGKWALNVKFHPEQEKGCGTKREMSDAKFRFVDAVNRAPMWIRKDLYEQHLHHIDFRFAPFQYDDDEICLRSWQLGLQVGWYDAKFQSLTAGGMRLWNSEFTKEQMERNGKLLYQLYADKMNNIAIQVEKSNQEL